MADQQTVIVPAHFWSKNFPRRMSGRGEECVISKRSRCRKKKSHGCAGDALWVRTLSDQEEWESLKTREHPLATWNYMATLVCTSYLTLSEVTNG